MLFRSAIVVGVAVVIGIGIVLMFLLTQATNNRELYERNYGRLFALNMVVAGVLLAVILWVFVRLASRLRRGSSRTTLPRQYRCRISSVLRASSGK